MAPNVGLAGLDVTKQRFVSDPGDTTFRKIDGSVEVSAVSECELATTHEGRPGEGERGGEHPAVVVVGELSEDIRENITGDRAAGSTGPRPVTPLGSTDKAFEDGVLESIERPPILNMDGPEAREIFFEGGRLDRSSLGGGHRI